MIFTVQWDARTQGLSLCQVFFHKAGQFQYYTEQETMPNSFRIDFLTFKEDHESILTLKKSSYSSLDKPPDRQCQARLNRM